MMRRLVLVFAVLLAWPFSQAWADRFDDTIKVFKSAGDSARFFDTAYGYAVFPTIGKAAFIGGGAFGVGHVYEKGEFIGETKMTQLSAGFQAGAQAYSQIVFFEDERALKEFTKGSFEFGADVGAVAITASANASASTQGSSAGVAGGRNDAIVKGGGYTKGMAIFTVAKGGAMFQAAVAGQKFSFKAKAKLPQ